MIPLHKSQKKTTDFEIFDLTTFGRTDTLTDSGVYSLSECNKKKDRRLDFIYTSQVLHATIYMFSYLFKNWE